MPQDFRVKVGPSFTLLREGGSCGAQTSSLTTGGAVPLAPSWVWAGSERPRVGVRSSCSGPLSPAPPPRLSVIRTTEHLLCVCWGGKLSDLMRSSQRPL